MRILLAAPMLPQPQGPGAIPVVLYAELVGLLGNNDVTLVTTAGMESGDSDVLSHLSDLKVDLSIVYRKPPQGFQQWQRRWRFGSAWMAGRLPWRSIWFWEPEIQRRLDDLFIREDYDLLIVEDNAMGVYEYKTSIPSIFTEHEVRRPRPPRLNRVTLNRPVHWALAELDWMRWKKYQLFVWRKFTRIQTFSNRDAMAIRSMEQNLGENVRVNPFGIVLSDRIEFTKQDDKTILFVGNFTHLPNVDAALWLDHAIMPLIRELYSNANLVLVGYHPTKELLALGKGDFQVLGPVRDIVPFMEQAAVVIAPVRIGGGMRMKVLHAMAMGKAVVTTSRGLDGLSVYGSVPVVVGDTAEELAKATVELLVNRDHRIALGRAARKYVEAHFSPQAYAQRIEALYGEIKESMSTHPQV